MKVINVYTDKGEKVLSYPYDGNHVLSMYRRLVKNNGKEVKVVFRQREHPHPHIATQICATKIGVGGTCTVFDQNYALKGIAHLIGEYVAKEEPYYIGLVDVKIEEA